MLHQNISNFSSWKNYSRVDLQTCREFSFSLTCIMCICSYLPVILDPMMCYRWQCYGRLLAMANDSEMKYEQF